MIVDFLINQNTEILRKYLQEISTTFIISTDKDFNILDCNEEFLRLFNLKEKPTSTPLSNYIKSEKKNILKELKEEIQENPHKTRVNFYDEHENSYLIDCTIFEDKEYYIIFGEKHFFTGEEIIAKMSVLNYELSNMTRDLNKKNIELKKANNTINNLLRTDPLTEISNRRCFIEALEKSLSSLRRHKTPCSLVMIDIDRFKYINDYWGHSIGDQVLIDLGKILEEHSRKEDLPARLGGEEFVILLPHTSCKDGTAYAEKIRQALEKQKFNSLDKTITASFGVTELKEKDSSDSALNRADTAMYKAKEKGRNRVEKSC